MAPALMDTNIHIITTMKIATFFFLFSLLCLAATYTECYHGRRKHRLRDQLNLRDSKKMQASYYNTEDIDHVSKKETPRAVYVGSQKGRKEADKIDMLLGQPDGIKFNQYSGYVTVDPKAGRALFYYFAEAENPSTKPLVLWLNGGPGCSSIGGGAMEELGPFRVNPDGKSLKYNKYAWNNVANVIFLESPAGVGFSYSNTSSDYVTGDIKTASDSYTFLLNWLERFPEYKTRDFFLTGESYAGHYVPQLADLILENNKNTKNTIINLKGIAIGNAFIDFKDRWAGTYDHYWTSAFISDEAHEGIIKNCNFTSLATLSKACLASEHQVDTEVGDIDIYNIYAPLCSDSSSTPAPSISSFDPCSDDYVSTYLNNPEAQKRLHANITRSLPGPWEDCNDPIFENWTDTLDLTVLPVIKKLIASGKIRFWIFSGDVDGIIPVTTTLYSMPKLDALVQTPWYPWYSESQVGGYAVGYEKNLTFLTVRGAGHMVPSHRPGPALTFFTSFLQGKLPPGLSK